MLNHSLTYGPLHHQRQQQIVSDSTMQTYLLIGMFIIQVLIGVLVVVIWARNQYDNNRLEVLLPEQSDVNPSNNIVTQRLLGPDGMNRLRISDETASAIVTDITPKTAKFDMGELRSHLEEDGEYTAPEVETIVTLYKNDTDQSIIETIKQ